MVRRRNLFPNPNFNPNGAQPTLKGVTMAMSVGSLSLTAASTELDRYAMFIVRNLNPGDSLVSAVRVTGDVNGQYPAVTVSASNWSTLANIFVRGDKTVVSSAFTVPDDGILRILFYPYRHDGASDLTQARIFTHPQLELASTFTDNDAVGGRSSAAPRCRCINHREGDRP